MSGNGHPPRRSVFVVDAQFVVREGVKRILEGEPDVSIAGDSGEPEKILRLTKQLNPDLVLLDIAFDGTTRFDLVRELRRRFPRLGILIFSMHSENLYAERALRSGANGYLMKSESPKAMLAAIRQILSGRNYASDLLSEKLLLMLPEPDGARSSAADYLSDRELEVFELIGKGFNTRDISSQLSMAKKTVETHRQHIRRKLSLKSTVELVQRAIHWVHHENVPA